MEFYSNSGNFGRVPNIASAYTYTLEFIQGTVRTSHTTNNSLFDAKNVCLYRLGVLL